jgi:hypothetical protein
MSEKSGGIDLLLTNAAESVIGAGYALLRISVCVLSADGGTIHFVSVWGARSEVIFPGATMHVGATVFPEVVRVDGPVTSEASEATLAAEVVRHEGVRAWISVPLRNDIGLPVGLMNFSSRTPEAFKPDSVPYFAGIGAEIEAKVLSLISL